MIANLLRFEPVGLLRHLPGPVVGKVMMPVTSCASCGGCIIGGGRRSHACLWSRERVGFAARERAWNVGGGLRGRWEEGGGWIAVWGVGAVTGLLPEQLSRRPGDMLLSSPCRPWSVDVNRKAVWGWDAEEGGLCGFDAW